MASLLNSSFTPHLWLHLKEYSWCLVSNEDVTILTRFTHSDCNHVVLCILPSWNYENVTSELCELMIRETKKKKGLIHGKKCVYPTVSKCIISSSTVCFWDEFSNFNKVDTECLLVYINSYCNLRHYSLRQWQIQREALGALAPPPGTAN